MASDFERLIAEGESAPVAGWDFSWFAGRATEQRPSWGYARLIGERMAAVSSGLDIQTGGGEVLATIGQPPPRLCATESWPPNGAIATRNLAPLGCAVVQVGDDQPLPFRPASFDLITSRHPTVVLWHEISRVLRPGGTYLSQQIGVGSNRALYEYLMGPLPHPADTGVERVRQALADAGLTPVDVRHESTRVTFDDVGAVVAFLRKVIWTVPDFSVRRYRQRLSELHDRIQREGPFVSSSERVLVVAEKPAQRMAPSC